MAAKGGPAKANFRLDTRCNYQKERVVFYLERVRPDAKWVLGYIGVSGDISLEELTYLGFVTFYNGEYYFLFPLDIAPWTFWETIPEERSHRVMFKDGYPLWWRSGMTYPEDFLGQQSPVFIPGQTSMGCRRTWRFSTDPIPDYDHFDQL